MMYAAAPPAPQYVHQKKAWETSSSEDSDFEPASKKKKMKPSSAGTSSTGKKRGRPCKEAAEKKKKEELKQKRKAYFLSILPPVLVGVDVIDKNGDAACKKCEVYFGHVALKPCGHAKFCFNCVKELRADAVNASKFLKCPLKGCSYLAKDWVVLRNVSA